MSLLPVVLAAAAVLLLAYRVYGKVLQKLMRLDPDAPTPAVQMRDDLDFVPIEPKFLVGQHFSAIAAAGPIVGPILAGIYFGWGPAIVWIVLGAVLIGGVHDYMALVASIRHKARSIAEVVREHMSRRSYMLFLTFIWFALVYIIVAFTDITASSFVGAQTLESGEKVLGGGIATSSLLYLALPVAMGLLMRFGKLSLGLATAVFLPLVALAVVGGQHIPLQVADWLGWELAFTQKAWGVFILTYCVIAALLPMWILLQPRGHLGGYFLYASLIAAGVGVIFSGKTIQYPAFLGWHHVTAGGLFPILFITIACGAVSGFHALIASGTTAKQLRRETDAKFIGYGTMLMEAMVAVVALSCVMILAKDSSLLTGGAPPANKIYAQGIGAYLAPLGIPMGLAVSFALMAFTTFVYDTLDVCTRLGKYIVQELTGWRDRFGAFAATAVTAGVPLMFLLTIETAPGSPPAWRKFWGLFGASNQLLAALTLLGVTVWLWRTRRAAWVLLVTGVPTAWMYVMSVWALVLSVRAEVAQSSWLNPVALIGALLVGLAGMMLVEAVAAFGGRPTPKPEPVPVAGS